MTIFHIIFAPWQILCNMFTWTCFKLSGFFASDIKQTCPLVQYFISLSRTVIRYKNKLAIGAVLYTAGPDRCRSSETVSLLKPWCRGREGRRRKEALAMATRTKLVAKRSSKYLEDALYDRLFREGSSLASVRRELDDFLKSRKRVFKWEVGVTIRKLRDRKRFHPALKVSCFPPLSFYSRVPFLFFFFCHLCFWYQIYAACSFKWTSFNSRISMDLASSWVEFNVLYVGSLTFFFRMLTVCGNDWILVMLLFVWRLNSRKWILCVVVLILLV